MPCIMQKFSLYLFEDENLILTPSVMRELEDCKSWLSVGYHAHLDEKADIDSYRRFQQCFSECGLISTTCRLHKFTADNSLIHVMYESGIRELLCSDDRRVSYGIPVELYGGGTDKMASTTRLRMCGLKDSVLGDCLT